MWNFGVVVDDLPEEKYYKKYDNCSYDGEHIYIGQNGKTFETAIDDLVKLAVLKSTQTILVRSKFLYKKGYKTFISYRTTGREISLYMYLNYYTLPKLSQEFQW